MKRITISIISIIIFSFSLISCSKVVPPLGLPHKQTNNADYSNSSSSSNSNNSLKAQAGDNSGQLIFKSDAKSSNTNNGASDGTLQYTKAAMIDSETAEKIIKPASDTIIMALKNKDMETLASYVHPLYGVRFSPFTYVSASHDVVFGPEKIKTFFQDTNKYIWGYYGGNTDKIELTPTQYYNNFIYNRDFVNADVTSYNKIPATGSSVNNLNDIYNNAIAVEYYFPGFKAQNDGLDWQSLILVFNEDNGAWYLTGIIHNSMDV